VTRIHYQAPEGRSALEVLRNYDQSLQAAGFTILFQCQDADCGRDLSFAVVPPSRMHYNSKDQKYLAAKLSRPQGDAHVMAYTVVPYSTGGPDRNRARTQLDVVESKPMRTARVKVDADAMARVITANGRIALYGIHFDHDKAEMKSESKPALDEIAKLLKQERALKLLIVGHTDNAGGFYYNLDLSRRRAQSVVQALVSQHGIDGARLKPWGVSYAAPVGSNGSEDGRAKNRRVELVAL